MQALSTVIVTQNFVPVIRRKLSAQTANVSEISELALANVMSKKTAKK